MSRSFAGLSKGKLEGFLVEEMVSEGSEMILGYTHDAQLGAGILIGLGGVMTEIFKDTAMRLVPVTRQDARDMIGELKSSVLLTGFRGRPEADVDALVDAICSFSDMIVQLGDRLVEAEINPLFVLPKGRGVKAADGVVIFRGPDTTRPE